MREEKLEKVITRKKKRVGRGYGSGRGGHTAGRGMKGQKSRTKIGILFEGVKVKKSLIKRLPLRRGKGKFKPAKGSPIIIKLDVLNLYPTGATVNVSTLSKLGIVRIDDAEKYSVKILGGKEIKKKLSVDVPISKSAAKAIKAAGGKVVGDQETKTKIQKKKPGKVNKKQP